MAAPSSASSMGTSADAPPGTRRGCASESSMDFTRRGCRRGRHFTAHASARHRSPLLRGVARHQAHARSQDAHADPRVHSKAQWASRLAARDRAHDGRRGRASRASTGMFDDATFARHPATKKRSPRSHRRVRMKTSLAPTSSRSTSCSSPPRTPSPRRRRRQDAGARRPRARRRRRREPPPQRRPPLRVKM